MSVPGAQPPRRPKVLLLIKGLGTGGAEMLAATTARPRPGDRLDHEVAYLLPDSDALAPRIAAHGTPVRCYQQRRGWDPRWLLQLRRDLARPEVAVVHSHSPVPAVGARLMARTIPKRVRPKVFTTFHNTWGSLHPLTRTAYHLTNRIDDAHFSVSQGVHASLPPAMARRDEVIIHGVDVAEVRRTADRAGARAELGIADDELLVGTIANLRHTKGYPDLLLAARTVTSRRPGARFVIVGDGPMRAELEQERDDLGLGATVSFLGSRMDATRLLSGFDLLCLASHHEGLPVVLMESMALGVPVVVTRVGGVEELVSDGVEGRLVHPHRPDELASAILDLLEDPRERANLAAGARRRGEVIDSEPAIRTVQTRYAEVLGMLPEPPVEKATPI